MLIRKLQDEVCQLLGSQQSILSIGSAVRELIQNSADGNCREIEVYVDLENWEIVVRDDGDGISREDLDLLGERYYTSKLENFDEVEDIKTFGFRGEGLHILKNICCLSILSKTDVSGGSAWLRKFPRKAAEQSDESSRDKHSLIGRSKGTTVIVENIFYNMPIRRNLLKGEAVSKVYDEIKSYVLQVLIFRPLAKITVYATENCQVKKIISGHAATDISVSTRLVSAITSVFGLCYHESQFASVHTSYQTISVEGVILKFPLTTKSCQSIYINKRQYEDKKFLAALNRLFRASNFGEHISCAYGTKTAGQQYCSYPAFVIMCHCPSTLSDLLQNPGKTIIHSTYANIIQTLILRVAKSFLKIQGYKMDDSEIQQELKATIGSPLASSLLRNSCNFSRTTNNFLNCERTTQKGDGIRKKRQNPDFRSIKKPFGVPSTISKLSTHSELVNLSGHYVVTDFQLQQLQLKKCTIINQIDKKFVMLKSPPLSSSSNSVLLMIDQHAADERIKLETYITEFLSKLFSIERKSLLTSCDISVPVSPPEFSLIKNYIHEFHFWGIEVELPENEINDYVLIRRLPILLDVKAKRNNFYLKGAILQHARDLEAHLLVRSSSILPNPITDFNSLQWWKCKNAIPRLLMEIFNSKACRSAIMFGDFLTREECVQLVERLSLCNMPFQCAHGRPSVIPILELGSKDDLSFGMYTNDYIED
ncbi:HEL134Wp [Eremothecium sinecaudum]|uniref:HEL134Wp n=1 Tax=Eremothecium sinecaudum TaxID=45286 RepID=A0A0X8HSQ0_9SACH|nr:HEL134Wp [Eremothecium sinecaudum]AMD21146.1 HEL134Wp [Eremothecium sinecaudum]